MYTTIKNDKGEVVFYGSNFDLWDDYISHAEHEDVRPASRGIPRRLRLPSRASRTAI